MKINPHPNVTTSDRVKQLFKTQVADRQSSQLSNIVIGYGLKRLGLTTSVKSILIVVLALTALLFLATTTASFALYGSRPALGSSIFVSFLTAFSFGVIKYLDYDLIESGSSVFPAKLADYASDNESLIAIISWLRSFLSLKKQILVSTVVAVFGLASTIYLASTRSYQFKINSYLLLFCCFFAVGHGVYCTIFIPTLVRELNRRQLTLFWLNPAASPWVKDASRFFTRLAIVDSIMFSLGLFGLYSLRPLQSSGTTAIALAWFMLGVICISYIFLYPHWHLNQSIKRAKKIALDQIRHQIEPFPWPMIDDNDREVSHDEKGSVTELLEHVQIYKTVEAAKETAIDTQNASKALSSILLLILSYYVPSLLTALRYALENVATIRQN